MSVAILNSLPLETVRRTTLAQIAKNISATRRRRSLDFETAQALGVPLGTVKAQLARARAEIARQMRRVLAPGRRTHLSGCATSSTR